MLSRVEKKWRLFRAWAAVHPVWCSWQVTYRCNFRCAFCHYWKDPLGKAPETTLEEFRYGARQLASVGSIFVSLAGGEPLLREDLPDIVAAFAEYHFPLLTTNGYALTPRLAKSLWDAGLWGVSVSLDYADPAKHDRRRGMKGAWDRAVEALTRFVETKEDWQRVNIMTVLMDDNLDEIEPLLKLAAKLGAYFMLQPYCELKTGSSRFRPPREDVARRLLDLHKRYRHFLSNRVFLSKYDEALNGGIPGCRAGRSFFNVDSTGEAAICVEHKSRPVANILRDPASFVMSRLRDAARQNRCRQCWYNCRGEIEVTYDPVGVVRTLPTILFDRGIPPSASHA